MLAICEECSKKYTIDVSKIQREQAHFFCQKCGHIIVVTKLKNSLGSLDAMSDLVNPHHDDSA